MSLSCLIVDDEPIAQNIVKSFIGNSPNLTVAGICNNAMEALPILQAQQVDILFLDIEMPVLSGLSFLKTLARPPATIITTAYREFALEGYELNVVDYLLKPFSFERFLKAVNKVDGYSTTKPDSSLIRNDFEYFRADRKNIKVHYDDILLIEGLSNYVKIHMTDKQLVVYHRLIDLEKRLPKDHFVRIHKSFIVSVTKIEAYGNDFVEIDGRQLSIGNTYKAAFMKVIRSGK